MLGKPTFPLFMDDHAWATKCCFCYNLPGKCCQRTSSPYHNTDFAQWVLSAPRKEFVSTVMPCSSCLFSKPKNGNLDFNEIYLGKMQTQKEQNDATCNMLFFEGLNDNQTTMISKADVFSMFLRPDSQTYWSLKFKVSKDFCLHFPKKARLISKAWESCKICWEWLKQ